jgi:hypothetical protein
LTHLRPAGNPSEFKLQLAPRRPAPRYARLGRRSARKPWVEVLLAWGGKMPILGAAMSPLRLITD